MTSDRQTANIDSVNEGGSALDERIVYERLRNDTLAKETKLLEDRVNEIVEEMKRLEEERRSLENDYRLNKAKIDSLGSPDVFNTKEKVDILLKLSHAKDALKASARRIVEAKEANRINRDLALLAGMIEEARVNQLSATTSEIILYIFGFKWFWGLFTGYRSTFIDKANEVLQNLYSAFSGHNAEWLDMPLDIIRYEEDLDKKNLELQAVLSALSTEFPKLAERMSVNKIREQSNELVSSISSVIDRLQEKYLRVVDNQRLEAEQIAKDIVDNSTEELNALYSYSSSLYRRYNSHMTELSRLYGELIQQTKIEDKLYGVANISYKEAASFPLQVITTEFGMLDPASYQGKRLAEFREWRNNAAQDLEVVRQQIANTRDRIAELVESVRDELATDGEDTSIPAGLIESFEHRFEGIVEQSRKAYEVFVDNKKLKIFDIVAKDINREFTKLLNPLEIDLKAQIRLLNTKDAEYQEAHSKQTQLSSKMQMIDDKLFQLKSSLSQRRLELAQQELRYQMSNSILDSLQRGNK